MLGVRESAASPLDWRIAICSDMVLNGFSNKSLLTYVEAARSDLYGSGGTCPTSEPLHSANFSAAPTQIQLVNDSKQERHHPSLTAESLLEQNYRIVYMKKRKTDLKSHLKNLTIVRIYSSSLSSLAGWVSSAGWANSARLASMSASIG